MTRDPRHVRSHIYYVRIVRDDNARSLYVNTPHIVKKKTLNNLLRLRTLNDAMQYFVLLDTRKTESLI